MYNINTEALGFIIVGPTGVGKTDVAMKVAKKCSEVELISADAFQIYRGFDIGTSKPPNCGQGSVRHHMIDICSPQELFSLAVYQQRVQNLIYNIIMRGKIPLLVGGTGLYIDSIFFNYNLPLIPPNWNFRRACNRFAKKYGNEAMHNILSKVAPLKATVLHPNNSRRVIRALEVALYKRIKFIKSGKDKNIALKSNIKVVDAPVINWKGLILDIPNERLFPRIKLRLDSMIKKGWITEINHLYSMGACRAWQSMQAIGYREGLDYLEGLCDLKTMLSRTEQITRKYIKRQRTWWRRYKDWIEIDPTVTDAAQSVIDVLVKH